MYICIYNIHHIYTYTHTYTHIIYMYIIYTYIINIHIYDNSTKRIKLCGVKFLYFAGIKLVLIRSRLWSYIDELKQNKIMHIIIPRVTIKNVTGKIYRKKTFQHGTLTIYTK